MRMFMVSQFIGLRGGPCGHFLTGLLPFLSLLCYIVIAKLDWDCFKVNNLALLVVTIVWLHLS